MVYLQYHRRFFYGNEADIEIYAGKKETADKA